MLNGNVQSVTVNLNLPSKKLTARQPRPNVMQELQARLKRIDEEEKSAVWLYNTSRSEDPQEDAKNLVSLRGKKRNFRKRREQIYAIIDSSTFSQPVCYQR